MFYKDRFKKQAVQLLIRLTVALLLVWARLGSGIVTRTTTPTTPRHRRGGRLRQEQRHQADSFLSRQDLARTFRRQCVSSLTSSTSDDCNGPSSILPLADPIPTVASEDATSAAAASTTTIVTFSPYSRLMQLDPGECETSEPIHVTVPNGRTLRFCVKLYPRGGGHTSDYTVLGKRTQSGFGMSYKVLPFFSQVDDKVGVYLQYIPNDSRSNVGIVAVDTSFALRMLGRQTRGPKFDVEFRSGMRFVPDKANSKLKEGRANDFGAHLMQTSRLAEFLGVDHEVDPNVQVQVSILVHRVLEEVKDEISDGDTARMSSSLSNSGALSFLIPRDIRGENRDAQHDAEQVRVGRIVVPVLTKLDQRPRLFQLGAYPGVEYRIMRVVDPDTDQDLFYSRPGADYELKPIYPLVAQLERPWPVRVNERDLPKLYTSSMYNAISAVVSFATAVTGLLAAFCISQAVSLFFIPSHSMDPTLQVGDVLLVDKVTPRLFRHGSAQVGDVVLFHPPRKLQEIVSQSGGRPLGDRDLFIKRVAAVAGDVVTIEANGHVEVNHQVDGRNRDLCDGPGVASYLHPGDVEIAEGQLAVLGDCAKVSIDSRVWGPLPTDNIVGRPLLRLWPLSSFGSIPSLSLQDP